MERYHGTKVRSVHNSVVLTILDGILTKKACTKEGSNTWLKEELQSVKLSSSKVLVYKCKLFFTYIEMRFATASLMQT